MIQYIYHIFFISRFVQRTIKLVYKEIHSFGYCANSTCYYSDRFDHRKNKVVKRGVDAVSRARRGVEAASRARRDVRCQPWAGADPFFQVKSVSLFLTVIQCVVQCKLHNDREL